MSFTPDKLHPLIEPFVPGCPVNLLNTAIRSAASDFCARTKCWRERVTITVTNTDYTAYQPTLPAYSVIHEIEAAWFDDVEMTAAPFDQFTPEELSSETGRPRWITQRTDGQIRLVPRATGVLVANLILKPPQGQDGPAVFTLHDMLLYQHAKAVAAGALGWLLSMPKKPWSDMGAAAINAGIFERKIGENMGRNKRGQQRAPRRSRGYFI